MASNAGGELGIGVSVLHPQSKAANFSVYLRNGELQSENGFACGEDEANDMREFVIRLLADPGVLPPKPIVVDVGVITGRGWAVIEQNGAWAAGIYGCDPNLVLDVIQHATVP